VPSIGRSGGLRPAIARSLSRRPRRAVAALAVAAAIVAPGAAAGQTGGGAAGSLQAQVAAANDAEVQALSVLLALRNSQAALEGQVNGLNAQLADAQAKLAPLAAEASRVTASYDAVNARVQASQAQLDGAERALAASAATLLRSAVAGDGYTSIQAAAPSDLTSGEQYLRWISQQREVLVATVRMLRDQIEGERRAVAAAKAQADGFAAQATAARDQVQALVNQLAPAQRQALSQQAAAEQALSAIVAEKGAVEADLASIVGPSDSIAALLRRDAGLPGTISPCDVRPVPGGITSPYGPRIDPITGAPGFHSGVDLQAGYGTPIRACRAGIVRIASPQGGYGNAVVIDHGGGMATLYAHQSRLGVVVDQQVNAGDVIGYVGATGFATGPHLHFEVRLAGDPVNPMAFLP
jgi:murein DD-endopeptidase MepM/ murein hydrolase activator NlpD